MTIWADFGSITMCNNNKARISAGFAVRTRLELATYGVTGRYSNQLNYRTFAFGNKIAIVDTAMLNRRATCASALRFRK